MTTGPERDRQLAAIVEALRHHRHRRHPAEVTSDRIADHLERWWDRLTGQQGDTLADARQILADLADHDATS